MTRSRAAIAAMLVPSATATSSSTETATTTTPTTAPAAATAAAAVQADAPQHARPIASAARSWRWIARSLAAGRCVGIVPPTCRHPMRSSCFTAQRAVKLRPRGSTNPLPSPVSRGTASSGRAVIPAARRAARPSVPAQHGRRARARTAAAAPLRRPHHHLIAIAAAAAANAAAVPKHGRCSRAYRPSAARRHHRCRRRARHDDGGRVPAAPLRAAVAVRRGPRRTCGSLARAWRLPRCRGHRGDGGGPGVAAPQRHSVARARRLGREHWPCGLGEQHHGRQHRHRLRAHCGAQ